MAGPASELGIEQAIREAAIKKGAYVPSVAHGSDADTWLAEQLRRRAEYEGFVGNPQNEGAIRTAIDSQGKSAFDELLAEVEQTHKAFEQIMRNRTEAKQRKEDAERAQRDEELRIEREKDIKWAEFLGRSGCVHNIPRPW